jgi:hydrogenase maturation factor
MLIATVPEDREENVVKRIREVGVKATKIGTITTEGRKVRRLSGETKSVEENVKEELWKALKTRPRAR